MKNSDTAQKKERIIDSSVFFGCASLAFVISLVPSFSAKWDFLCLLALICFIGAGLVALVFEKRFLCFLPDLSHFRLWFVGFVVALLLPLFQVALASGQFLGFFRTDSPMFVFGIANLLFFLSELADFLFFSGLPHSVTLQKHSFALHMFSSSARKTVLSSTVCLLISFFALSGTSMIAPEGRLNRLSIEVSQKAADSDRGYSAASVVKFSDSLSCSALVNSFSSAMYLTIPLYGASSIQQSLCKPVITFETFSHDFGVISFKTFSTYLGKSNYVSDWSSLQFIGLNSSVSSTDVVPLCLSSQSGIFFRDALKLSQTSDLIGKTGSLSFQDETGLTHLLKIQVVNLCDGATKTEAFYDSFYGEFGIIPRNVFETFPAQCVSADFPIPSAQAYARDVCSFLVSKTGGNFSRLSFSYEKDGSFVLDPDATASLSWISQNRALKDGFALLGVVLFFGFIGFAFAFLLSSKTSDYELTIGDALMTLGIQVGLCTLLFLLFYLFRIFGTPSFFSSTLFVPVLVLTSLVGCALPCFFAVPWSFKGDKK